MTLTGFARPGSVIEFFIAAPDPSGFGEGKTYIVTLTEGSVDDIDATTGSYGSCAAKGRHGLINQDRRIRVFDTGVRWN